MPTPTLLGHYETLCRICGERTTHLKVLSNGIILFVCSKSHDKKAKTLQQIIDANLRKMGVVVDDPIH